MTRANRCLALSLLLCACGSRTGPLTVEERGPVDARVRDASFDSTPAPTSCACMGETLLAADTPNPTSIAVDATHVYWASTESGCEGGRIQRVPKCGGPIEVLADDEPNPRALVLDDERVYYYDACGSGILRMVPKTGGPITTYPISVGDSGRALAVGPDQIYFTDYGLLQIPKSGGVQSVVDADDYVYAIATDARAAYWIGPIGGGLTFGVWRYLHGDSSATMIATPPDVSNDTVVDEESLYFFGGNNIWRMPKDGGPIDSIAAGVPGWRLAVDERFVYWTFGFMGTAGFRVNKIPKTGGEITELGSGEGAYLDIAVDESCVYVANLYGDEIRSFPK